jgi:ribosomal protein L11 methylase PrmA
MSDANVKKSEKPSSPAASHMLWFFLLPAIGFLGWATYELVSGINNKKDASGFANRDNGRHITETKTMGWEKTCQCDSNSLEKCKVLDIFCGSGTTGVVALESNGSFIGVDGNEEYIKIAKNNLDIAYNVLFRD